MNMALIIFSGGLQDTWNPPDVLERMDEICVTMNLGISYDWWPFLAQNHLHQLQWRDAVTLCPKDAQPLMVVGHSQGGAAATSFAHALGERGQIVDLLWTCDSVVTGDDFGNIRVIPPNVLLNINSYTVRGPLFWFPPFPIGKANTVESPHTLLLNIGMWSWRPGIWAHHDAFYTMAGGTGHAFPSLILNALRDTQNGQLPNQVMDNVTMALPALARAAWFSVRR